MQTFTCTDCGHQFDEDDVFAADTIGSAGQPVGAICPSPECVSLDVHMHDELAAALDRLAFDLARTL